MHYVNNTELFSHEETRRQFDGGYSGTAKDSKDYVYVGAVLEREINEWLTLGAELFGNGPTTRARISRPSTITSRRSTSRRLRRSHDFIKRPQYQLL